MTSAAPERNMLPLQEDYSLRARNMKRLMRRVQVLNKRPWLNIPELDMAITTCCSKINEFYSIRVNDFMHEYESLESKWRHAQRCNKIERDVLNQRLKEELQTFLPNLELLRNFVMQNYLYYTKNVKRCIAKVWLQRACMKGLMKQKFYLSKDLSNIWVKLKMLITEQPKKADWRCPICYEIPQSPIVLSCAHWFCSSCLARAGEQLQNKCPVCRKIQKLDPSHPTVPAPYRPLAVFLHTYFGTSLPPQQPHIPVDLEPAPEEPTVVVHRRRKRRRRRRYDRNHRNRTNSTSGDSNMVESTSESVAPTSSFLHPSMSWSNVVTNSRSETESKAEACAVEPSAHKRGKHSQAPEQQAPVAADVPEQSTQSPMAMEVPEECNAGSCAKCSQASDMNVAVHSVGSSTEASQAQVKQCTSKCTNTSDESDTTMEMPPPKPRPAKGQTSLNMQDAMQVCKKVQPENGCDTQKAFRSSPTPLPGVICDDSDSSSSCAEGTSSRSSAPRADSHLSTLDNLEVLLDHARPGAFFALDIDDTLHMSKHHPCMMLSHQGIRAYQYLLRKKECYRSRPHEELEERRAKLQAALNSKRLVQSNTAEIVRTLQERGCWVFGCTSRYAGMAEKTTKTLLSLGIDLSLRSPFPTGKALFDPRTEALCKDGIVFTNAINKAVVLNRFLEKVVFRAYPRGQPVPVPELIFVDDRMENLLHIMSGLDAVLSRNIKLTCYHYVAALQSASPITFDSSIVLAQIDHFMEHMEILPDHAIAI